MYPFKMYVFVFVKNSIQSFNLDFFLLIDDMYVHAGVLSRLLTTG